MTIWSVAALIFLKVYFIDRLAGLIGVFIIIGGVLVLNRYQSFNNYAEWQGYLFIGVGAVLSGLLLTEFDSKGTERSG